MNMDLSRLTPDQRACVEHVDGPLLVCAGAGSGKTFMLTQRIAYALKNPERSGVRRIDQDVLAITFTKKAAGEIKARVRSTLRSLGMGEQAQLVDGAWIGTIHGTCERILRAHALDLGLDPDFTVLDDHSKNLLRDKALNDAIKNRSLSALFELFDHKADEVHKLVNGVLDKAAGLIDGVDAIELGPEPRPAAEIAREAIDAMRDMEGAIGACDPKSLEKVRERTRSGESGLPALEGLLAVCGGPSVEQVHAILEAFNYRMGFRKEALKEAQACLGSARERLKAECILTQVAPARGELVELVRGVSDGYEKAKRAVRAIDQDDLLRLTLSALRNNEAVAREYRDKFRLVMVDEFQDTDQMQVEIVRLLSGGLSRLCTVGDVQQSIYGFRGADVEVYRDHRREMGGASEAFCVELGTNFRSHGEIIEFANQVFSRAFPAEEFLRLDYARNHEAKNPFVPSRPRVDIVSVLRAKDGLDDGEARRVLAEEIARRFVNLHEAGAENRSWGDMVILLARMKEAGVFVDALLARDIPCVVSGGSTFADAPEAREICALARAIADPYDASTARASSGWGGDKGDSGALGAVLTGDMFGLSMAELAHVVSCCDSATGKSLWGGLCAIAAGDALPQGVDAPTPRETLAAKALVGAVRRARRESFSTALRDVILASGWLGRLRTVGAVGAACAGNVLKALRMVEEIESDPRRAASAAKVAETLRERFEEGMKEGPGALNLEGKDAVRIMTIHASKGLEFPIVALADCFGCKK